MKRILLAISLILILAAFISISRPSFPHLSGETANGEMSESPAAASPEIQLGRDAKVLQDILNGLETLESQAATLIGNLGKSDPKIYTQSENDFIRSQLLIYLNYRTVLFRILHRYQDYGSIPDPNRRTESFILAYAAGLALFEKGLVFIQSFEGNSRATRKLNEGDPTWNLPAGVYSSIRSNLSKGKNIEMLREARVTYETLAAQTTLRESAYRPQLERLRERIEKFHESLAKRSFHPWDYRFKNLLGKVKSGTGKPIYKLQTWVSTLVGDTKLPMRRRQKSLITLAQVGEMKPRLQPGDIIIERRNWYLSNAFLPGFWPHAALYVGTAEDLERLGLLEDKFVRDMIGEFRKPAADGYEHRVIEALSEGVVFSSLEEATLADSIAVLRPRLLQDRVKHALSSAFSHHGKPYDFEFDFFTTDKLVCTELVYRCYDGAIQFGLVDVLGRRTLPAIEIVKKFGQEYQKAEAELEFVLFLDGEEDKKAARFSTAEELIESTQRSGFTWLN